jgi:hypothetical protein
MTETFKMLHVAQPKVIDDLVLQKWIKDCPELGKVWELFSVKARGEVVTLNEVEETCGWTRHDRMYQNIMRKLKVAMVSLTGIAVRSRPRIGYVLTTVKDELMTHVDRTLAGSQRKIKQQALQVSLVRQEELSLHERRLQSFARDQCLAANGLLQSRRETFELHLQKPEQLPRLASETGA